MSSVMRGLSLRVGRSLNSATTATRASLSRTRQSRGFALAAHGTSDGQLVNRVLPKGSDEYNSLWDQCAAGESAGVYELSLNHRQTCDIELLLNGAFSPLNGFMNSKDYESCLNEWRLSNGTLWPMPITLDVSEDEMSKIEAAKATKILLRDGEHNPIAVLDIEDVFKAQKKREGEAIFGGDPEHPAVAYLNSTAKDIYIGGTLHGFQLPPHYDHRDLRRSPAELRALFAERDWNQVCAFQTRNPMHRAHYELTLQALDVSPEMKVLVHPVVGMTKPGDIDHHTRVKCYREILPKYPAGRAECSVFPLAMRMGGPAEAIWHMIIRKNFGCTHFILGRDHAGPGSNSKGEDFYGPYDARDAAVKHEAELGITPLSCEMMLWAPEDEKYYPASKVPEGKKVLKLSGTEVRRRLRTGEDIPEWFSFAEVVKILREAQPPRHKGGLTLFFTGLSGSGKSTIANALMEKLMEIQARRVTMLDGDYVRKLISSELGFSKEHRNLNIKRIGFISSMIARSGGIAIAAPIAPYAESRDFSRQVCSEEGGFIEIFVSTSVDTCSQRDRKGLYKKAMAGQIALTGVNDPYEEPANPELVLDTDQLSVGESVDKVIEYLLEQNYLTPEMVSHEQSLKQQ